MRWRLYTSSSFCIVLLFSAWTLLTEVRPESERRLILISWDGAADWVVDRLLEEGKLPNLQRMIRRGVRAEYVTPAFPSKTAPGHAAIWTGAFSDINGVFNNTVPFSPSLEHSILESRDGFDSSVLRAEPIWLTAALAGKRVVALSATHQAPAAPYLEAMRAAGVPEDHFLGFDGFRTEIAPPMVIAGGDVRPATGWTALDASQGRARDLSMRIGDQEFHVAVFDSIHDPTNGFDSVRICPERKKADAPECILLKPAEARPDLSQWSRPVRITQGGLYGLTYFRLFLLTPDGQMVLYRRAVNGFRTTAPPEIMEAYLAASGGFIDDGVASYLNGTLGPTLWNGGQGAAERRLVEIIRLNINLLDRGARFALEKLGPDLLLHYTSTSDSVGHAWMGALDPDSPTHDARLAARLWPFYSEVLQLQDAWLGTILNRAGGAVVSLVSDHGMAGAGKIFYPNAALEEAGLLVRTEDGAIDLSRTKVCAPPWGDFFVSVNSTAWKDGIVRPEDRDEVLREAVRALLAVVDPDTGAAVVKRVLRRGEMEGTGGRGEGGGDLYLDLADGYAPSPAPAPQPVRRLSSPIGNGVHGFNPLLPKMHSIWYATGAGLARGRQIGPIRQIDIAPTLGRLLGIAAPRHSIGRVVNEAFADDTRS